MEKNCDICGKHFNSEGHENGEWLNLCHECNERKGDEGSVSWSDKRLKKLYKKLNDIAKGGL
jgi:hypothetical protein